MKHKRKITIFEREAPYRLTSEALAIMLMAGTLFVILDCLIGKDFFGAAALVALLALLIISWRRRNSHGDG